MIEAIHLRAKIMGDDTSQAVLNSSLQFGGADHMVAGVGERQDEAICETKRISGV